MRLTVAGDIKSPQSALLRWNGYRPILIAENIKLITLTCHSVTLYVHRLSCAISYPGVLKHLVLVCNPTPNWYPWPWIYPSRSDELYELMQTKQGRVVTPVSFYRTGQHSDRSYSLQIGPLNLTLEGPCIIFCNICTFQRDTQCSSTDCLLMLRCQLYLFRTVTVHPQELLFRCCMCRLWYVVRNALSGTSRWCNVWGRTYIYIYRAVKIVVFVCSCEDWGLTRKEIEQCFSSVWRLAFNFNYEQGTFISFTLKAITVCHFGVKSICR